MTYALFSFACSLLLTFLVVRFSDVHAHFSADHDLLAVQKAHAVPVPRVGGVGIFLALVLSVALLYAGDSRHADFALAFLAPASIVFAIGLLEDLTKRVSVTMRLLMTMLAALVGCAVLDATVRSFGVPGIDLIFQFSLVAFLFTIVAVAGVANAINLIDGFNGLSGFVCATSLACLAVVAFFVGDELIWTTALVCAGAVVGFLVWNYPRAKIFLGDGGAYLAGFVIAELAILLRERNPEVSVLFPLLLLIYPIFETLFSIYRRRIVRGQSPGAPDAMHLHQLINKRLVRWRACDFDTPIRARGNSLTSPYLWGLNLLAAIPAVIFWDDSLILSAFILLFIVTYVWLYARIVRFQSPAWLPLPSRAQTNGNADADQEVSTGTIVNAK